MKILNIAGYKFIKLDNLPMLKSELEAACRERHLLGTILLTPEGINVSLAGLPEYVADFMRYLEESEVFTGISFHQTYSAVVPFQVLKIKLKNEIITFKQKDAMPATQGRAPTIAPEVLKTWLDQGKDITLLDTRNDYEYRFGSFRGAINLHIHHFTELPESIQWLDHEKPVVMFCTGGVRCEKAALHMLNAGFSEVYQLDGGILGFFAKVGGAYFDGECFVFDERIALDSALNDTETIQCQACQGPVTVNDQQMPSYVPGVSCPSCA